MQLFRYYIYVYFLLVSGCQTQKLTKEKFIFTVPIVHSDSTNESFKTDFNIVSYKNFVLYELPFSESYQIEDSVVSDTMRYEYFVFKKQEKYGYLVKNLNDSFKKNMKTEVDSVLTQRAFYHFSLDSLLSLKNNLYYIEKNNDVSFRIKYPVPNIETDSIFAYFDVRYKGMKYSLAKELDASFKSKLYKTEFWLNRKGQTWLRADQLVASHEIKEDTVYNEREVLDFFTRFDSFSSL